MSFGDESAERADQEQLWYDQKTRFMEARLGREHDMVMHAIVPFAIGGALDLYYYPNGIAGTGVATKELSPLPGEGPYNDVQGNYELVMFTREPLNLDEAANPRSAFGRIHELISTTLNWLALYSQQAMLNPGDTVSFPEDFETVGGHCFLLDDYGGVGNEPADRFGLLLVMQIFPSELQFAQEHGTAELIKRLKARGFYPYSDLEREAVA